MKGSKEVEKVLTKFANRVVRNAKLKPKLRGTKLKDSIRHDLDVFPNSFTLEFFMNEYGLFQDKGVSGTQVKYLTKYSYTNRQPPTAALLPWVKKKFKMRDAKGRFKAKGYESLAYVIARSIKRKGIKPSLFFTKPFETAFKSLPDDVVEAYGLEVDRAVEVWLEKPNYTGSNPLI